MAGIPPSIIREMRRLFSTCSEFNSSTHLHALFVDSRLQPFGNSLPHADSQSQIVDNTIAYLHNRYLRNGSNALVNLILILAERYEEEYLGIQLSALADRATIILSDISYADAARYITAGAPEESSHPGGQAGFEQIIGISSLKNILWLQQGLKAANSVCRLLLANGGRGTGFLISSNLLLTNNHVVATAVDAETTVAEFNFQHDIEGRMKKTSRYVLDADIFRTNIALDYTLVGIKQDANKPRLDSWGIVACNSQAEPVTGEHLVIIQHPGGEPKQIAMTENYVKSVSSPYIRYTTDTRPGSSGAPVFNDAWQVVALHHRSVVENNAIPGRRQKLNEGILLMQIKQDAGGVWPGE